MNKTYTKLQLRQENKRYADTFGVSANNAMLNFLPAFQDASTGETHLSTTRDGKLAPIHLLDGLPEAWIVERDADGQIVSLKDSIIAGFVREGRFYTRAELAAKRLDS